MKISETKWLLEVGRVRLFRAPGEEITPSSPKAAKQEYSNTLTFPTRAVELNVLGKTDILVTEWEDDGMTSIPETRTETVSKNKINSDPRTKNHFYYQGPKFNDATGNRWS